MWSWIDWNLLLQEKPQRKRVSHRWKIFCYICCFTYCYFRWFLTASGTTFLCQDCMVVSSDFLPRILARFLVQDQNPKFLRNFHQTFWFCNNILVANQNIGIISFYVQNKWNRFKISPISNPIEHWSVNHCKPTLYTVWINILKYRNSRADMFCKKVFLKVTYA